MRLPYPNCKAARQTEWLASHR